MIPGLEYLALPMVDIKSTGDVKSGKFEGYASTRKLDSDRDICVEGCFKRTLDHIGTKGLPLLWFHDPREPIGMIYPQGEDSKGLYVSGECDMDTQIGADKYSGMVKGYIDRMSIGYKAVQAHYDRKQGARMLTEVALKEISSITKGWAANDEALITALKSIPTYLNHYVSSNPDGCYTNTSLGVSLAPDTIEELIASLTLLLDSGVLGAVEVAHEDANIEGESAATDTVSKDSGDSPDGTHQNKGSDSAIATLIRGTTKSLKVASRDEVEASLAIRSMIDGLKSDIRKDT